MIDRTTQALEAALNMRELRQKIISANIANAETPGYHARKLDFEDNLAKALDLDKKMRMTVTHPDHMGSDYLFNHLQPEIYENPEVDINNDGNTVNLEKEMASQAENSIMYKAALNLINKKLGALKYAASEGR